MKSLQFCSRVFAGFAVSIAVACSAPVSTTAPTAPTTTMASTPAALSSELSLISNHNSVSSRSPRFTIDTQTPVLTGSDDPRVTAFNERLNQLVSSRSDTFLHDFQQITSSFTPNGSYLNVNYQLISQIAEIWSLKIDFEFYFDGAAHPGHNSTTINYDIGQGRELALEDLFINGSDYIQAISDYCIDNLKERYTDDVLFLDGAAPTQENYSRWNITADGLMITFDEYQAAPYAAGPQTVVMPWGDLHEILNPAVLPAELIR